MAARRAKVREVVLGMMDAAKSDYLARTAQPPKPPSQ